MTSSSVTDDGSVPTYFYVMIGVLLMLSGLFSGLNLGLMSLDAVGLDIVERSQDAEASKFATALKPVRAKGNFLLCTLLLGNTLVNALLAIFLADISGGVTGSLITTFGIVIFGEIIPQSICSRHGLAVGYYTRHLVLFFMVITAIISWPIAKMLDWILGKEIGSVYNREQLRSLVEIHSSDQHGGLNKDEVAILTGALGFTKKKVKQIMSPIEKVFTLNVNDRLDHRTLARIVQAGYSRVPVLEGGEMVTILLIKNLIVLDPNEGTPVRQLLGQGCCLDPYYVDPEETLDEILNEFQKGRTHMAIVQQICAPSKKGAPKSVRNVGLLTLEDVIEALIQEDIEDETDHMDRKEGFVEEYDRFRELNDRNKRHAHLPEKEVEAVSDWLLQNHGDVFHKNIFSSRRCKYFVRLCEPVLLMPSELGQPKNMLWEMGDEVHACYLVLSDGPLHIHAAGDQDFTSDLPPWHLIGIDSLTQDSFRPDFSVEVAHPVRVLKIERKNYQQFIAASSANSPEVIVRPQPSAALLGRDHAKSDAEPFENADVAIELTSIDTVNGHGHGSRASSGSRAKSNADNQSRISARLQLIANPKKAEAIASTLQQHAV